MGNVIRLTERDLTRIVKLVINEEQSQAKSKQMASQAKLKITSCWDAEKYPSAARAFKALAYAGATVALIAAAAALSATGVGIPAALALVSIGGSIFTVSHMLVDGLASVMDIASVKEEMKELASCLFENYDYFDIF